MEKSTYIFNTNIQKELSTFLGKKLDIDLISFSASSPNHNAELPNKVAEDISNSISVAITAAVTTTVATISGGLGQSLGIAIISGLLGVSGPIGMIIGGFAALLVSGGAYKINKKSLTNYIKNRHLPSFILFSINFKKIEKGRADIYSKIHEEIDSEISQKVGEVIEELINEIGPKINKFI